MMRFFRCRTVLICAVAAVGLPLAACNHAAMSQQAKEKQLNRIFEEMKGPDIAGISDTLQASAEQAEQAGNHALAAQYYNQLLEKQPENPQYILRLAESQRRSGRFEEAVVQYTKLLNNPTFVLDAKEGIGLCRMAQGEFEAAGNMLADVMERDATRWRTINAIGILFTVRQMYPEARQYFAEALAQSPRNASVYNNFGLMEALANEYDEAIVHLQDAARLTHKSDPLHKHAQLNLALVYAIKGNLDMAEETARPHLTKTQLLNNMGYYAHLAKDDVLAKSYLSMALTASDKHYEKAWKNLETMNKLINAAPRRR